MDKKQLITLCLDIVNGKLLDVQNAIDGYKIDLMSETKSSAGDKHETGRAMLQLEMEKLGQQHQTILMQKEVLSKIQVAVSTKIALGSLVVFNGIYYFIATSIGQVKYSKKTVMVVSVNSPIGVLLLGKEKGSKLVFNGKRFVVQDVL
ncbi:transcription elongation GreA/GreB family factor [Wenyingzhuangia heitensis]|uniref:Transcription elongation GreA/GreB family factor n=1 Tax=Wenyingzhuangia heitensis TaxID=1487859 RepID=A0ABX0UAI0_9FLAO|nr:3-oxoacyl-ACP synthase [Wenyingzhuangia heitensis]NIJ44087.1 transcription elongation GreA/GreB family factor [Wenyingzhuangia heitensis]